MSKKSRAKRTLKNVLDTAALAVLMYAAVDVAEGVAKKLTSDKDHQE